MFQILRGLHFSPEQLADLACHTDVPKAWKDALQQAITYDIRITPPPVADPLTGVMMITVTDAQAANAFAAVASVARADSSNAELLIRYIANHWGHSGLSKLLHELNRLLRDDVFSGTALKKQLRHYSDNARLRVSLLQALAIDKVHSGGLLHHPVIHNGPLLWRMDAIVTVRRLIAEYEYQPDKICR